MPIEIIDPNKPKRNPVEPPTYEQLTEFQIWFFFYIIRYEQAPTSLRGVTKNMCLGVKMNLDYKKFDFEQVRLRTEVETLWNAGLLDRNYRDNTYFLSEVGELYLFQEILGPIIKSKQKKQTRLIINYISKKDTEAGQRVIELIDSIELDNPFQSFKSFTEKILKNAMPWMSALKEIHSTAKIVGNAVGIADPTF